jgi:hypothetical protein
MSKDKKAKIIHVDKLVIHAKDVEIIQDQIEEQKTNPVQRRTPPLGFLFRRPQPVIPQNQEVVENNVPIDEQQNQEFIPTTKDQP